MEVAHGSIMSGHMGIKKTTDKIKSAFYWPRIQGDVTRFCKSRDVCQKTVSEGSVPKVPLEKIALIDNENRMENSMARDGRALCVSP